MSLSFLFSRFLNRIYFLLNDFVSFKIFILISHFSIITICILIFVINILLMGVPLRDLKRKVKIPYWKTFGRIFTALAAIFFYFFFFFYMYDGSYIKLNCGSVCFNNTLFGYWFSFFPLVLSVGAISTIIFNFD